MNRISKTLKEKDNILSIYFTAGFPELNSTIEIIKNLVSAGVDMIEIGLPFSDPLADGETIQMSSKIALDNGISTNIFIRLKSKKSDCVFSIQSKRDFFVFIVKPIFSYLLFL